MRLTRRSKSTGSDPLVVENCVPGDAALGANYDMWRGDDTYYVTGKLVASDVRRVAFDWKNLENLEEEKGMNLFAVILVGPGKVIDRQWRIAADPDDVLVQLGGEGVQPEQIVVVHFVTSLSEDNLLIYES